MMTILIGLIYLIASTIMWALWRAWYGGQFKDTPLGNHRGVQTIFMLLYGLPLFVFNWHSWQSIAIGIAADLWVCFMFWSRGHGPALDMGADTNPSQSTIDRYADRWFNTICQYFLPLDWWYSRTYDALWMFLRYTCPMLLMSFISPLYLLCGIVAPFAYDYSWKTTGSWRRAEYIMGATFGFVTALVRLLACN